MPRDHWSDFASANAFLDMVAEFNELVRSMFAAHCGWIEAMDMVGCFHHLPCSEAPVIWDRVAAFWAAWHVLEISVPPEKVAALAGLGVIVKLVGNAFPLSRSGRYLCIST
eukprot:s449_g34.t1